MASKKNKSVTKYRRPFFIDPGAFIFILIAIYILVCLMIYLVKPHISIYEVPYGSIADNQSYTGIIVRQEQVIPCELSGYITYYAREATKVGARSTIFSIDETGQMSDLLEEAQKGSPALSSENITSLNHEVEAFLGTYSNMNFSSTYDFEQTIEGTALEMINTNLLEGLTGSNTTSSFINMFKTASDGVISYQLDGYESLTVDNVTQEILNNAEAFESENLKKQSIINASDPVYKIITDDEWTVVIETESETAQKMLEEEYIEVTFARDRSSAWGKISTWEKDGKTMVGLTFTNSMIHFASERYINFEFQLDNLEGLKIPNSALLEDSFYIIPVDYLTYGGNSKKQGVYIEYYEENGTVKQEFKDLTIYNQTDTQVYVSMKDFDSGNSLIKPESQERYTIGKTEKLTGVYNTNKGYTIFTPVNILTKSEEYSIAEANTRYGLSKYDHIVLDASTVSKDSTER